MLLFLLVRTLIFSWCFFILSQSSFYEGPGCLRFFTVWNFIALTIYFGIGAGLATGRSPGSLPLMA